MNANDLIDRADAGEFDHLTASTVARTLLRLVSGFTSDEEQAIQLFDTGNLDGAEHLRKRLWGSDMQGMPENLEARRRLVLCLFSMPRTEFCGYEVGYFVLWARHLLIDDADIICAFEQRI